MKLKDEIIVRKIANETIALFVGDERTDLTSALFLNPTAEFIFDVLKKETDKNTLVSLVCEHFGTDRTDTEADLDIFLANLSEKGFLI